MKTLCRLLALLLLATMATLQLSAIAHAYNPSPHRIDSLARPSAQAEEYDYVADVTGDWAAEFDAAHEEQIGWADGYCILTAPEEWSYCT